MQEIDNKERQEEAPGGGKMDDRPEANESDRSATGAELDMKSNDGLPANLQSHIGRHLRAVFDEVAREPIPDRFLQLLKDLDQSDEDE